MRGFEEESWTGAESLFDLQSIQNQVKTLFGRSYWILFGRRQGTVKLV